MMNSIRFTVMALAAGLLVWGGSAMADEPSMLGATQIESADLLGAAVSSDELGNERGMSGLVISGQDADQNVTNTITSTGDLFLEAGQVMLQPGAVANSSFNVFAFNTGMNVTTNIQFLLNVYIE